MMNLWLIRPFMSVKTRYLRCLDVDLAALRSGPGYGYDRGRVDGMISAGELSGLITEAEASHLRGKVVEALSEALSRLR